MEQKTKKYEELNAYERAITNATLEQRLEAMAKDLAQISLALGISIHIDSCFHDWDEKQYTTVDVAFIGTNYNNEGNVTKQEVKEDGDLLGIITEALSKKN